MIEVSHLTKYYGEHVAVDDLSFSIEEGHVYGFLGPNGAGKSTTMNIITGCLSPTAGRVQVDGHDIFAEPLAARRCIGYLPEQPPLYLNESPEEYLRFVGEAKGLRGKALQEQIDSVMEQTGITQVCWQRIAALSKGYKQRVGIAQALLGDPKVIILDEPTVGLDPLQILEIRQLIRDLGKDRTVIFSSHILTEVQAICDRVLIISGGRLAAFGEPADLERKLRASGGIRLVTDAPPAEAEKLIARAKLCRLDSSKSLPGGLQQLELSTDAEDIHVVSRSLFCSFAAGPYAILEMSPQKADLETVFLSLTEAAEPDTQEEEV